MFKRVIWQILAVFLGLGVISPEGKAAPSPLDPLTDAELKTMVEVLNASGKVDKTSQYTMASLAEPEKADVLAWSPGDPFPRRGFAAIRHERQMYEAIVDLGTRELISWTLIENAQPILLDTEWMLSQQIVRADEAWRAAIAKRGVKDYKRVFCFPAFPGNFNLPRDEGNQRLGMVSCYDSNSENAVWGRPIPGILAIVDYDQRKIVELIDNGDVQVPEGGPNIDKNQPTTMPALGPAVTRIKKEDNWIEWDKWKFHLRVDPRVGPILSQVSIRDGDQQRSVLYQGSLAEMSVPYMDPTETWYFRTYLDVGEYGIGASGSPMKRGKDCPADSLMLDATFLNERGGTYTKEGVVCVFERETGDSAWTHFEAFQNGFEMRRYSELVVRFVVWLGNYDYVVEWIFSEDGSLKGRVGATGVVQVKGVHTKHMSDETAEEDTAYGRLIAPNIVAINHDHFFAFRLDVDVDGTENTLRLDKIRKVNVKNVPNSPRKQIWQVFEDDLEREKEARINIDPTKPSHWRIINDDVTNGVGNVTSYQLKPGVTGRPLMNSREIAHARAAFADYNLWVTPYALNEKYPAGDYPNRAEGGLGLPKWTSENRDIKDKDIVLWYTIGMHHAVRAEDWPLMPRVSHQFELRPFDFFDSNPAVD